MSELISQPRIAFQGERGAFSEEAAVALLGEGSNWSPAQASRRCSPPSVKASRTTLWHRWRIALSAQSGVLTIFSSKADCRLRPKW